MKKKVNIGIELIREQKILFLDVPTCGLNSNQALSLFQTLKGLT